jgi:hypothetical protein
MKSPKFTYYYCTNPQINRWPDGTIEVLGDGLNFRVADYYVASSIWEKYQNFLQAYPEQQSFRLFVQNRYVEIVQPCGEFLGAI